MAVCGSINLWSLIMMAFLLTRCTRRSLFGDFALFAWLTLPNVSFDFFIPTVIHIMMVFLDNARKVKLLQDNDMQGMGVDLVF